jgi:hypothetical protein
MPMCAPDCDCKHCVLIEMTMHSPFKENIEAMLDEFTPAFVRMRRTREENNIASFKARQLSRIEVETAFNLES